MALLISTVITLYLWGLLYSFDLNDPAWNFAAPITTYQNIGGIYGAWFSDVLFTLVGIMAWLIPPAIGTIIWRMRFIRSYPEKLSVAELSTQLGGVLLILISGSALSSMYFRQFDLALPASSGGILGEWISSFASILIGSFGGTTLFLLLLYVGIPMVLKNNWLTILEKVGAIVIRS